MRNINWPAVFVIVTVFVASAIGGFLGAYYA
jgi:hypothetical protein